MSIESSSDDGSDIFWPGYVDAVTNLVLNLLFLLTIMTVAVFMFALELGRAKPGQEGVVLPVEPPSEPQALRDPIKEREMVVAALRKQVDALNRFFTIGPGDVSLCFLPLSHALERAWTYMVLANGCLNTYVSDPPGRAATTHNVFSALLGLVHVDTAPHHQRLRLLWIFSISL